MVIYPGTIPVKSHPKNKQILETHLLGPRGISTQKVNWKNSVLRVTVTREGQMNCDLHILIHPN